MAKKPFTRRIYSPMKKTCGLLCLLFLWAALLCCPACYGQYYGRVKVSIKYMDGRPKSRGTLLAVSDSALRVRVKTANPAYRADPGGRHRAYLTDTLTIAPAEMARLRVGFKSSKWRVAAKTSLVLAAAGAVAGFIVGSQSGFGLVGDAFVGVAMAGAGAESGFLLGFIINDFTKKKYTINGSRENYRKLLPELQGYQGRDR